MRPRPSPPDRPRTWPRLALGALALPALAVGQTADPAPAQRVEVRTEAGALRRADTAGRQVVGRDELLRHGDTRLVDALQRVPGVSVEGRGQTTELKLGGLGAGYTQVLLNGEPLPRDTALDSIALDSIERVEIIRGSTVQSSQAIAGSINLITRQPAVQVPRDYRLNAASQWGRPQLSASLNLGAAAGAATWGLGLVASHERQHWPATYRQTRLGADGVQQQRVRTDKVEHDLTDAISLNPRLAWKRVEAATGATWQLSTDHSLRHAVSRGGVLDHRTPELGPAPAQQASELALNYTRLFWRGRLQATHKSAEGTQTDIRLNITYARRDQDSRLQGLDFVSRPVQDATVIGHAVDQSAVLHWSHQRPLGAAHRLDLGSEWEQARRKEDRVQTELPLPGGLPPQNLDERYDATVRRWAVYLQDDWTVSPATALQLGVRLEELSTTSEGNVFDAVRQTHRLVGPVLRLSSQASQGRGTFKLGLSRGFKLPTPRDVMPRRYVPIEVSATSPAFSGTPELRPEQAWSLDASWHLPLAAQRGELVVSAALRRIDDVILDRLSYRPGDLNAPWLLQRFNCGRAWSTGLEFELRGQTDLGWSPGAPLRWQAGLALARSRLDDVAADRPALAGQPSWQLKLNLTQRLAPGWTGQLGLDARGPALADQPSGRRIESAPRHSLNAGLTWQPRPRLTWRFSADRLAASDAVDLKTVAVQDASGLVRHQSREAWHNTVTWRLGMESGF